MSPLLWEKAMPNELHDKGQRPDEREKLADAFAQADAIKLTMPPEESSGKPWHYVLNADQVTLILKALRSPISAGTTSDFAARCRPAVKAYLTKAEQAVLKVGKPDGYPEHYRKLLDDDANRARTLLDDIEALIDGKQPVPSTGATHTDHPLRHFDRIAEQQGNIDRADKSQVSATSIVDAGEATLVCRRPDKENTVCLYPKCKCYPVNADAGATTRTVPVEMTEEMLTAFYHSDLLVGEITDKAVRYAFRCAVEAAPLVTNAEVTPSKGAVEKALRTIFGSWHVCAMGTKANPLHPADKARGIKPGQLCDDCEGQVKAWMKDLYSPISHGERK